jgi:hypothetical protein
VLFALEASARVYCFGRHAFSYRVVNSFHDVGQSGLLRLSPDPDLYVELQPHLDTLFKLTPFSTNSAGFRDRERSFAKPPGAFRIAMIGASYVMGSGVPVERTVARVLEDRVAAARAGAEVLNFGVGGYTPWQSAALLERRAIAYHPDLIVFATSPGLYETHRVPAGPLQPVRHAFFDSYLARLLRVALAPAWQHARRAVAAPQTVPREAARQHMDEIFARLSRVARETGVPVVVAAIEHTTRRLDLLAELAASAGAHGLPFIDAVEPFARAGRPYACAHPLDCHPNAWAHKVFADTIYDALIDRRLVETARGGR